MGEREDQVWATALRPAILGSARSSIGKDEAIAAACSRMTSVVTDSPPPLAQARSGALLPGVNVLDDQLAAVRCRGKIGIGCLVPALVDPTAEHASGHAAVCAPDECGPPVGIDLGLKGVVHGRP